MKALVVDDDRVLADLISFTLRREGFQVTQVYDGNAAIQSWYAEQPDIIILDVNLPSPVSRLDGFEVCRKIREMDNTPIILLTVRAEEDDIVEGLRLGADDYMIKPFSPRQLVARVGAVLRRAGKNAGPSVQEINGLYLDPTRHSVKTSDGEVKTLTPLEYRLIDYLMLNAGQVLPFDDLIGHIWGPEGGDRDMLRQIVRRLRAKIEPDPAHPTFVESVPGVGYGILRSRT